MHGFAKAAFVDESDTGVLYYRWPKVPLAKIGVFILRGLIRTATHENVRYLSPHVWAFLQR
jgi:hypothetical protein